MRIHIVINPATGGRLPVLFILNQVFRAHGVKWDASITHEAGDARRLARRAVKSGVDVVAACGGDGTVTEVASALIGSEVPLAILPAGTGNVMAAELGIPRMLRRAVALACKGDGVVRVIDMGQINEQVFMLRASVGFEAAVAGKVKSTRLKKYLGVMAYGLAALRVLRRPPIARYIITLEDGRQIERRGLSCLIANAGSIGRLNLSLAPNIDASDGLLDVMIVQKFLSYLRFLLMGGDNRRRSDAPIKHWKAREVTVTADPPQPFQGDGDVWGHTPVRVRVLPGAVRIIVPAG